MKPEPLRARYIGYTTGTENHGDEALVWLIRDLLAPEIEVVLNDERPWDLVLLGGGTLINQSPWLIDFFAGALDRSRSGQGLVLGSGVGDLAFWGDHFDRWAPLLQRCPWVGVRGPDSLHLLQQHGVEHAEMIGDPYLWLKPPVERPWQPGRVGVNLGGTNNALWGEGGDTAFVNTLTEALLRLKAAGWRFEWISVWSRDLPLIEQVREQIDPDGPRVLDARHETLEAYSALAGCELFIGEKLHACAMAAVAGVPFIALEYQPKVRDFAASLDQTDWVLSTAERDPQVLIDQVAALSARRVMASARLRERHEALRACLESFIARVKTQACPADKENRTD